MRTYSTTDSIPFFFSLFGVGDEGNGSMRQVRKKRKTSAHDELLGFDLR